jgi:hypothetical protein
MVVMAVVEKGAAAVAVATSPAWGPAVVEVLGLSIPVASTLLSILGVVLARLVVGAREGWKAGDIALTGALCLIAFALVTELRPGPGVAVAWGVGIGASGFGVIELLRKGASELMKRLAGPPSP